MTRIEATNPRSGTTDYHAEAASPEHIAARVADLRLAQPAWASNISLRMDTLNEWTDALQSHSAALAGALTTDTGRRLLSHMEVGVIVERIRYWTQRAPQLLAEGDPLRSNTAKNVSYHHQRVPYSLVGVISPWNFPLILSLVDAIPALCAGCAVIIKPSEVTPRFVTVLRESFATIKPLAEVLEVVVGGGETGSALVDNVDMICFTGSVPTGRKVAVRAAENFIPACLELGGKDPAIVLDDADLDAAADALLRSAAGSCGQACMSIERIFVHKSVFDAFVDTLNDKAATFSFNAPDIGKGALYPFIDQRQATKVATQLQDALAKGAILHSGGAPEHIDGGYWMRPTLLTNISKDMLLMQEETFGPLLPLIPFHNDDEAIALANDSDYGLSGSVFGEEQHAIDVARRLQVGAVGINDASMTALIHDVEKQSFGYSGLGPSRMGDAGLLRFLRTKALMIQGDRPVPLAVFDEAGMPS